MHGCLRRTMGLSIAVLSMLLGIIAVGLIFHGDPSFICIGSFLGILATIGIVFGARRFVPGKMATTSKTKSEDQAVPPDRKTKTKFESFRWGEPPPTRRQFGYAVALGVKLSNGMTKDSVSEAIDQVLADREPATAEQLQMISGLRGELPRQISRSEANAVIEFLEDYDWNCPFCGELIFAGDVSDCCGNCGKNLEKVRVPIELPDRKTMIKGHG